MQRSQVAGNMEQISTKSQFESQLCECRCHVFDGINKTATQKIVTSKTEYFHDEFIIGVKERSCCSDIEIHASEVRSTH